MRSTAGKQRKSANAPIMRDLYTQVKSLEDDAIVTYNGAPAQDEDPADYIRVPESIRKAVRLG